MKRVIICNICKKFAKEYLEIRIISLCKVLEHPKPVYSNFLLVKKIKKGHLHLHKIDEEIE